MTTPVPPPPEAPPWGNPKPKKPFYKRPIGIVLIILGVFVVLAIIGAALGGGDDEDSDDGSERRRNRDAPAEEAEPENESFMTFTEFEAIQNGMTLEQVEQLVGGPGELVSENTFGTLTTSLYSWEGEGLGTSANVTFQGGGVVAKAQFGLP